MLNGKTVAVTGVSSGIGAATARLLMEGGARIVGFDRNEPIADIAEFHKVDIGDPNSIRAALDGQSNRFDGLCNIAGVPPTLDKHTVLRVNFFGLRHFTEAAAEKLNDGAPIVNLASLAGFAWRDNLPVLKEGLATSFEEADGWIDGLSVEGAPSYHLSKELVIAWTILNCQRWKGRGIRINCVSPGPVDTPILSDFVKTLGKRAEEDLKLNRAGTADEIARVVTFLCSPAASWINGADVAVDGGAGAAALQGIYFS